jgi:hypothetical protein
VRRKIEAKGWAMLRLLLLRHGGLSFDANWHVLRATCPSFELIVKAL